LLTIPRHLLALRLAAVLPLESSSAQSAFRLNLCLLARQTAFGLVSLNIGLHLCLLGCCCACIFIISGFGAGGCGWLRLALVSAFS
jgi:hypothetical protein